MTERVCYASLFFSESAREPRDPVIPPGPLPALLGFLCCRTNVYGIADANLYGILRSSQGPPRGIIRGITPRRRGVTALPTHPNRTSHRNTTQDISGQAAANPSRADDCAFQTSVEPTEATHGDILRCSGAQIGTRGVAHCSLVADARASKLSCSGKRVPLLGLLCWVIHPTPLRTLWISEDLNAASSYESRTVSWGNVSREIERICGSRGALVFAGAHHAYAHCAYAGVRLCMRVGVCVLRPARWC